MLKSVALRVLYGLLFAIIVPVSAMAQSTSAAMAGFVSDSTGSAVPDATVTITNIATGVTTTARTNNAGLYRASGLVPGVYRAVITGEGFKSLVRDGIQLHVEDEVSMNYELAVGSVNETVTVQAADQLVETTSPTVSQVIEGRQVQDTPLNGRNVMNLVALTPGVVPQGATAGAPTQNQLGGFFTNSFGWNNYQIAGGLAGQAGDYLDGAPLNVLYGNTSSLVPTQDAIQEFRVESSVVDPRYGLFGGGIVSFATKSGTNEIHGTVYEYLRNTVLGANTFFNNLFDQPRGTFIQNQFGGAIGAPIKRGKAFAFASYEGFRLALGVPNSGRVPTPAELNGDFTADAPIYDPTTGHQFECNGVLNVICPGRIDPTAYYMGHGAQYWPTPNTSSSAINFSQNGAAGSSNNQYTGRVDWSVGAQKLFGRYTYWHANQIPTKFFDTPGPNSGPGVKNATQQVVLGDTIVKGQTVIDVRASYLRYTTSVTPANTNVDLAPFGPFYAAIQGQVSEREFPNISVGNTISQPFAFLNVTNGSPFNNYALSGVVNRVFGRHTLSAGGEARRMEEYFNQTTAPTGLNMFEGVFTGCASGCTTPTGAPSTPTAPGSGVTPIADFLLGQITSSQGFTEIIFPSMVSNYGGLFVTDTFQYKPRLTFTYGVRWEMPGGFTEKNNRNTVLLPNLTNPLQLVDSSAYPSRSDLQAHRTLFSPRVGVSFQATRATIIRAGYSLEFLPQFTDFSAAPFGSPINAATTFVASGALLSNPLGGSTTLLEPIGRAYDGTQFLGQTIASRIPNQSFPYLEQYNANIQQMFGSSTVFALGYVGSRGEHVTIGTVDINQLPDRYLGTPASQLNQSLRPYPQYQNVNASASFAGDTYYNSLQATLTKRFSGGGTFLANYTWSKFQSNTEASTAFVETSTVGAIQDYNNLGAEKSLSSFDTPQRLVVSYILDLPFGNGKRFLNNSNEVVSHLVSGWNVGGISTFASGFPLALTATANTLSNVYGAGTIRPNYVSGCNKSIQTSIVTAAQQSQSVLNQACFTQPGDTSFGNEPRVDAGLRAQGIDNWDFSIAKATKIHESVNLEFRTELFNIFNRVQFAAPNTASGGALFGVISSQVNQPRLVQFSLRANF
jgi:Carboxypeptidase regulatory-like domain